MADDFLGVDDGASSPELRQAALNADITHLVGRSRAFLLELEGYLDSIGSLHDERAARVVEAFGLTIAETADAGTLRHLERVASELLRSLRQLAETVRPR